MYALLFDTESGELLSFMGFPFGTLRTAAVVAIAAKNMAREDSQRLGLFGVGRNAFGILKALLTVRSIKEISSPAAIPSGGKNSATRRRSCSASPFAALTIPNKPCVAWMLSLQRPIR